MIPPRGRIPLRAPGQRVLLGMLRCARGRPEGITEFGETNAAFLNSLAPLIAIPLVGTLGAVLQRPDAAPVALFLQYVVGLLGLAVISHAVAAHWGRAAEWGRYATALNWCHWLLEFAFLLAFVAASLLASFGLAPELSVAVALGALAAYGFWLQWFLARYGLSLSRGRALLLVLLTTAGTFVLVLTPSLLQGSAP